MRTLGKKFYGASLVALAFSLSAVEVSAQTCTTAPSCETLGFTKSASTCEGRSVLKCPFDQTKLFCDGAGETSCNVGAILYSDKTCSVEPIPEKTAIGVVFDVERRLAVGLEKAERGWSLRSFDVPGLANESERSALTDFAGKSNTATIMAYCKENNESCPAIEYVNSYQTEGTTVGDWYLPAIGELNEIYENKGAINTSLKLLQNNTSQTASSISLLSGELCWSSNEYWGKTVNVSNEEFMLRLEMGNGDVGRVAKYARISVRPVLAF